MLAPLRIIVVALRNDLSPTSEDIVSSGQYVTCINAIVPKRNYDFIAIFFDRMQRQCILDLYLQVAWKLRIIVAKAAITAVYGNLARI